MKKYQLRQIIREEISKAINNEELEEGIFNNHNEKSYKEKITSNGVEMKAGDKFMDARDMDDFEEVKMDDLNKKNKEANLYVDDKKLFGGIKKRYIDDILRNNKYEGEMVFGKLKNNVNTWKWVKKRSIAANMGAGGASGITSFK